MVNAYSQGRSEEIVADALAGCRHRLRVAIEARHPDWHQADTAASRLDAANLSLIAPHLQKEPPQS